MERMSNAKDERTLYQKMSDRAKGRGTTASERVMAEAWMKAHPEQAPARTAPGMSIGFDQARRPAGWTESDEAKRRRDQREEAAARREQEQRFAREHMGTFDADAFGDVFRQAFGDGFEEEMAIMYGRPHERGRGDRVHDPYYHAAKAETERMRAASRAHEREMREAMREARAKEQSERDMAKEHARQARAQAKAAADHPPSDDPIRPTSRFGQFGYRIDEDEAGNPIRRRTW